jgi:hypothetical protein
LLAVLPHQVLEHLESYAWYELGRQVVEVNGCIRVLRRNAYIDVALRKVTVTVYETRSGLAVTIDGDSWYLLQEYRTFRQRAGIFHSYVERRLR